ncbi:VWA domain-containing protein [Thauera mechernichensis]|uniref:VWA domain-containing protein n=1 Tax=Thauera mechernichensis TaxID=82788 RepID=A0ABW3WAL1_9RHOO|nr:VWA domain-containing protein [Thauera mechernichensis]MDG3066135.1 VWA domain-containing protein [Thauera mechernichensis]
MTEWFDALLPAQWLRPWALGGLLLALLLVVLGRRRDEMRALREVIDPQLLPHLLVHGGRRRGVQPADTLAVAVACFSVALAGPAWEREPPPLAREQAALMVVVDLSSAMDATDLPPSRLAWVRSKLHALLARRGDAPTGLIVYAGSAHLVLPPTDDRQLLTPYVDALTTTLMPVDGARPAAALALAHAWLERTALPGTVLFLTTAWPQAEQPGAERETATSRHRLIVWAIGTERGGPIRNLEGVPVTDASGALRHARLEVTELRSLRARTGASLVSVTADEGDLERIQALITRQQAAAAAADTRWRDRGADWVWPGLLALLMSFRRGWVVPWRAFCGPALTGMVLLSLLSMPSPAQAGDDDETWTTRLSQGFVDLWFTRDQQGHLWLERGDPARAAGLFDDPLWRGIAAARAGRWQAAAEAFAQADSAAAWFNQAQALARLGRYAEALAAYDQTLIRMPGWPEALADQARVRSLLSTRTVADEGEPSTASGEGDERGEDGERSAPSPAEAEAADAWLRRLDTSPAAFLRRKFALQTQPSVPEHPGSANR